MAAVASPVPQPAFHRKPVATYAAEAAYNQTAQQQPDMRQQQRMMQGQQAQQALNIGRNPSPNYYNNNTTTAAAARSPLPPPQGASPQSAQMLQQPMQGQSRRTLSDATSSSSTSAGNGNNGNPMQRISTASSSSVYGNGNNVSSIRRSTSSRSNGSASPTSYVALMRKQKATVWCDRAQHQDPRILAAQRQAKMRAVMEVAGGHNHSAQARISTSSSGITGGVRSKIRHHGAPKAKDYNSGNLSGAGVPMRLSATEVDEGDSDDEQRSSGYHHHQRASSSRSSVGSAGRFGGYNTSYIRGHDVSPPDESSPVESLDDVPEEQTPMPEDFRNPQTDYFGRTGGNGNSGSSGEAERNFGNVTGLSHTTTRLRSDSDNRQLTSDELRRRGSVDDRTMTMGGGRLFVANPDLSD